VVQALRQSPSVEGTDEGREYQTLKELLQEKHTEEEPAHCSQDLRQAHWHVCQPA
jgi:hypothetical protein